MPGCSLWLLPPSDSSIHTILSDLITTKIPSHFPEVHKVAFEPHLTLTSGITLPPDVTGNEQAQRWLDELPLPKKVEIDVRLVSLDVGAQYFKKITLSVNKRALESFDAHVRSIAMENGDMAAATSWVKETWEPHISLMYADIDVTVEKRQEILQVVVEAGIRMGKEHGLLESEEGNYTGWKGGRIALVETWKELRDWEVVASRKI